MSSYKDYKKKVLQNPEIKSEYDALQPEYDIIQAMIDARLQQNLTQKDLSARTGITQADISPHRKWYTKSKLKYGQKTCTWTWYAIKT